jgi:transposase
VERLTLLLWQRSTTISAAVARRGRMVLLLADGMTITDSAAAVRVSRRFIYRWVHRFVQDGVAGLEEKPRSERRIAPRPPDLREEPNNLDVG